MKLLILGPELKDLNQVSNYSGIWSYYLRREFLARDIQLKFLPQLRKEDCPPDFFLRSFRELNLKEFDHVLAVGNAYFNRIPAVCGQLLRERCRGYVVQISDHMKRQAPVITLSVCADWKADDSIMPATPNYHIGWAADPEFLFPAQHPTTLSLLIDHPYYGGVDHPDVTGSLVNQALAFAMGDRWRKQWHSVRVNRISDGAVVDCFQESHIGRFTRKHLPYPVICDTYRRTNAFFVTHPESVGLTCLEAAMAGALIVYPHGFLPPDRAASIRSIGYENIIPWDQICVCAGQTITNRAQAAQHTWAAVTERILHCLKR